MINHQREPQTLRSAGKTAIVFAAVCLLFVMWQGCREDREQRPELYPAEGTLTINGQPAAGARLIFHPSDGINFDQRGTRPNAKVDDQGQFKITTYQTGDGAASGTYDVGIIWMDNEDSSSAMDRLGGRYADPQKSNLTVTVQPDMAQLEPIQLTGVRIRTGPRRGPGNSSDQEE